MVGQAHLGHNRPDPVVDLALAQPFPAMELDRDGENLSDGFAGVQGAARVLEYQLDLPLQSRRALLAADADVLGPLEGNRPGGGTVGSDDHGADSGFTGAGLPHQAEVLPPANLEADVVNSRQGPELCLKLLGKVLDLNDVFDAGTAHSFTSLPT